MSWSVILRSAHIMSRFLGLPFSGQPFSTVCFFWSAIIRAAIFSRPSWIKLIGDMGLKIYLDAIFPYLP